MTESPETAETAAHSEELEIQVERLTRELAIPPCPAILARFITEMNRDEPDLHKLARFIGNDVALSAAMLSTVNSPYYGLSRHAGNVQQALSILGLRAGANLITRLLLRDAFPAAAGTLMQRFWDDSTLLAETAAEISTHIRCIDRDEAQTYALFRDCGMAVMITRFSDYGEILDTHYHSPGVDRVSAEDIRYRFNHARVGYALALGWLLPEPLCNAILVHHDLVRVAAGHHDTSAANPQLVAVGLLGEQVLALRDGSGLCPDWIAGEAFVLNALNLDSEQIVAISEADSLAPA